MIMKIGIIGGSGLYDIDGLSQIEEKSLDTPFGKPSDQFICGKLEGIDLVFLPRHARGHKILPGELNHKANIFAMKSLGVDLILSISAVGSFQEHMAPGDIVLVDQFIDRTKRGLDQTFFGNGIAGHISFAHPTCCELRESLFEIIKSLLKNDNPNNVTVHNRGSYLNMEGPAFSTLAESMLYKSWGLDLIGMTNMAEAKLAREAEICYQTIAMVTDYDCWHPDHDAVTVEMVIKTLIQNASLAKSIIKQAVPVIASKHQCDSCPKALQSAIITNRELIPDSLKNELKPIIGKYIT